MQLPGAGLHAEWRAFAAAHLFPLSNLAIESIPNLSKSPNANAKSYFRVLNKRFNSYIIPVKMNVFWKNEVLDVV